MAKAIGSPLNPWSGRVGGQVYAISGGQQVIRSYQPIVSNPRTTLQMQQRAKVVLAGGLSQIIPDNVILGLASSRRERRSELTRRIIKNAVAQESDGKFIGLLAPEGLILSNGRPVAGVSASFGTLTTTHAELTPTFGTDVDAVMLVAVVYDANEGKFLYVNYIITILSGVETTIPITAPPASVINYYVIPLVSKTSAAGTDASTVDKADESSYLGTLTAGAADTYEHMRSQFIGSRTVPAA